MGETEMLVQKDTELQGFPGESKDGEKWLLNGGRSRVSER